jgi:hypothetical protein
MTFEAAPASLHHLLFGGRSQEAGGGPVFLVGGLRQGKPKKFDPGPTQFAEQQVDAGRVDLSIAFMRPPHRGDLVVDAQGWKRDDNDRQSQVLGSEAFAQGLEVRNRALVESGLKRPSEFGLAGAFVCEREKANQARQAGLSPRPLSNASKASESTEPPEQCTKGGSSFILDFDPDPYVAVVRSAD